MTVGHFSRLYERTQCLLASLRDLSLDRLRTDQGQFGPLLETFVFGEILKLASIGDLRFEFSHFRDKQQNEVDIVIEDRRGRIVGIEIKAAASVSNSDFSGLRILAEACGERICFGHRLVRPSKGDPLRGTSIRHANFSIVVLA